MTKTKRKDHRPMAAECFKRFGLVFDPNDPKPLRLGTHRELAAALQISVKSAREFLGWWTSRKPYLRNVSLGKYRFSLTAEQSGEISGKDQQVASKRIAMMGKGRGVKS